MRKITRSIAVVVSVLFVTAGIAQAPKYVLLEEFTGMNCGPCAAQNPGFLANILTPNPIVVHHIAYHPSWPGTDIMYTYNPHPVDSMVMQYGVTGVPNVEMLGNQKNASPSGITQSDINNEFSGGSPIKVQVNDVTTSGQNHTATVVVTTVGTVPAGTYRLRTCVNEYLYFATAPGGNGEKDFPHVFRKMMPGWAGDAIVLPAIGSSVTFTYNYLADTLWKQPNVKLTSYVQNTVTNEVLNCGATGDPAINYTLSTPAVTVQHGAPAQVNAFNFSSLNTGASAEQFAYSLTTNAPGDWSATFSVGANTYTHADTITTPANSTNTIVINVTPGTSSFVATYTMTVKSVTNPSLPPMISNVYVISNISDLIVNNSGYIGDGVTPGSAANWDSVYTTGLAYSNEPTTGKTDEKVMAAAIAQNAFAGVRNIYLNIGWTFPAFTDVEVAQLTAFLNAGGCLLVSGQDVGWDTWGASPASGTFNTRTFYTNFLNAAFVWDGDSIHKTMRTVRTDPIWTGMPDSITVNHFYGPAYFYPDGIKPVGLGTTIYTYSDTSIAGVRATNGVWKTVYLGAGVEMLGTYTDRRLIIKRAHDWFYGLVSGIGAYGAESRNLGLCYPNPGNSLINIPLSNIDKPMTLEVTDLSGRVISRNQVTVGLTLFSLNTTELNAGVYMYRLMDGAIQVGCHPMEVTR